jgi:hypothetical protein
LWLKPETCRLLPGLCLSEVSNSSGGRKGHEREYGHGQGKDAGRAQCGGRKGKEYSDEKSRVDKDAAVDAVE